MNTKLILYLLCSLIIGALVWTNFFNVATWLFDWMNEQSFFVVWTPNRTVYTIGLASIPVLGYVIAKNFPKRFKGAVLVHAVNVLLGVLVMLIAGYIIAKYVAEPPSALLPDYIVYEPFSHYSDMVLLLGLGFYPAATYIYRRF